MFRFSFSKKNNTGFTLIEVIAAIFLIIVGLVGVLIVVQQFFPTIKIASSQLTAAYLVQEGIEIVRNIRDTNWLNGQEWTTGIFCSGPPLSECQADYTNTTNLDNFTGEQLKISSGFYSYQPGISSPFVRKITVASTTDSDNTDIIDVTVLVTWQMAGKSYQASATEYLYNWK